MKKIDGVYKVELNFVEEFNLSHRGMIKEIETEFDIIRLCFQELNELDEKYQPMLNRILVMPLRKLLCESGSVLLKVCPSFKMPPLVGFSVVLENQQVLVRPPYKTEEMSQWISIEDWLKQNISWFNRTETVADIIPQYSYECIVKKLNGRNYKALKAPFEAMYCKETVEFKGKTEEVYCKQNPTDGNANQQIYDTLDKIGYNTLSIFDFLKHMSDKRGAHIDVGHSLVIEMVNNADSTGLTPIHCFAAQMVFAAKKQIPELMNYWPEMPNLIV